jgi:nucleotide-binding universal stress UspA family protein
MEAAARPRDPGVQMTDVATKYGVDGGGRSSRALVVARTYEPRADAEAHTIARALAERIADAGVVRADGGSLAGLARQAMLVLVGTPRHRRPPSMPGGNASVLARRLGVPVIAVPAGGGAALVEQRSIVCGVRDRGDAACVAAAGALADVLELQLVLVHAWDDGLSGMAGPVVNAPVPYHPPAPPDLEALRAMVADAARAAGRVRPGAACQRIAEGPAPEALARAAAEEQAALVAVGASHRRPLAAALLGSVARQVTRHADRPVLVCADDPAAQMRLGAFAR